MGNQECGSLWGTSPCARAWSGAPARAVLAQLEHGRIEESATGVGRTGKVSSAVGPGLGEGSQGSPPAELDS